MRKFSAALVIGFAICGLRPLEGQSTRVAVAIADAAAQGRISAGFTAALRSLGDIEVVELSESPHFVISGVVACEPADCRDPQRYAIGLRLYSPANEFDAWMLVGRIVPRTPTEDRAQRTRRIDSLADIVWPRMRTYETTHRSWVVQWDHDRYEQATREFVREVDRQCFERERILRRAGREPDLERGRAIAESTDSRTWICWP